MSEGKRPGGLTALAVINFVFGGFGALGSLGMLAIMAFINVAAQSADNEGANEAQREMAKAWEEIGMGFFYLILFYEKARQVGGAGSGEVRFWSFGIDGGGPVPAGIR